MLIVLFSKRKCDIFEEHTIEHKVATSLLINNTPVTFKN